MIDIYVIQTTGYIDLKYSLFVLIYLEVKFKILIKL